MFVLARKPRAGRGLLPPNPKQWSNEHHGLDLRDELGVPLDCPLSYEDAFALLDNVDVLPHGRIDMERRYIEHFRTTGREAWSGLGLQLPNGSRVVIYNDSHPLNRIRATLMEEFFHLRLGHPTSSVRVYSSASALRTHNSAVESEAYGSGAAALVPYKPLRAMIEAGRTVPSVAVFFEVSTDLVYFRAKVTRLYSRLSQRRGHSEVRSIKY